MRHDGNGQGVVRDHGTPIVAVRDLRVDRGGREILHGISFDVAGGEVVCLLGPNGSGKTTLMRALVGMQVIKSGTITVLGEPAGSPALHRTVGYSPQNPTIYTYLTVEENLVYFAASLGAGMSDVRRVIREVGLGDVTGRIADTLSGSESKLVSLAVALLGEPELLILDEPTLGLDLALRVKLWDLFNRVAARRGTALLISSHLMEEPPRCQRVLLMQAGAILADDTPEELLDRTSGRDSKSALLHLVDERVWAPQSR